MVRCTSPEFVEKRDLPSYEQADGNCGLVGRPAGDEATGGGERPPGGWGNVMREKAVAAPQNVNASCRGAAQRAPISGALKIST